MKHCTIIILLLFCKHSASANPENGFDATLLNQTIGYQIGYSSSPTPLIQAFDYSGLFFAILNYGYNYQSHVGSKVFVGLGISDMLKIQYGYALGSDNHILRLRSDWMICEFWERKVKDVWKVTYLEYSTIGIFAERRFGGNPTSGYSIGISFSFSMFDVLYNYDRYKDNERRRKLQNEVSQL
jgi:hypothetical protein